MGIFDFFKKSKSDNDAPAVDKNLVRMARVAADKHSQNYDRMEAIQALGAMGTEDSAAALLKRFTFYIEPSITDQEEKETAFRGILAAGEAALDPVREFCVRAQSLTWPMKIFQELLDEEAYVDELLALLERFDTDYIKNVEPKVQVIAALEGRKREDVLKTVEPFLQDFDEPARFHAVATIFSQEDPEATEALCVALTDEESVRVKNRVCEGLLSRGWNVPEDQRSELQGALPPSFMLDGGKIKRAR